MEAYSTDGSESENSEQQTDKGESKYEEVPQEVEATKKVGV